MKTEHEILMEDPEFRRLLSIETLVAEASEVIAKLMADQNVNKAELARRLNKSRSWVTQLLSGTANLTVRTLAEVAHALDAELKLRAQPPQWKGGAKPLGTGWQPVSYRTDTYTVDPPTLTADTFELRSNVIRSGDETPDDEDARSEFAA
jgi:transcriptional regulator with XRE-family HTH domain